MITSAINFNLLPTCKNKKSSIRNKSNVSFCAENANKKPVVEYLGPQISLYFRKGFKRSFNDIVNAIRTVMTIQQLPKILIVGVGKAQEPLSYLAVIQNMFKFKPIESLVDLNCVDFQPKISDEKLAEYSKYPLKTVPEYASGGFVSTNDVYHPNVFKPEITQYLKNIFNNPNKSRWNTKIEDFAEICPKETYNIISINNVLMYIKNHDAVIRTLENIAGMLKVNGVLITDECVDNYPSTYKFLSDFIHLAPGIWKKIK